MNTWYTEVRTKPRHESLRYGNTGSTVKVRYDYKLLVKRNFKIALEDSRDNGVEITPEFEAQLLKGIRKQVRAFIKEQESKNA